MITYKAISETGNRENNEDSVSVFQEKDRFCAALGDGLGGHGYGDMASRLVTENVTELFGRRMTASEAVLRECFEKSQARLLEEQARKKKENSMKTTLCVLMADGERLLWGHIGDSRIYRFVQGELAGRTLDHSVPQMLVAAGEITEEQIRRHPDRNRLLRAMGIEWTGSPYAVSAVHGCEPGQAFLLCSDGFWEWIEERDMEHCLRKARSAAEWLDDMAGLVRANGREEKMDNYSAVCVWM